jgi:hypothetical protein
LRLRQISLAIAVAGTALVVLNTGVFAETLSVTLTGNWKFDSRTGLATGSQTSTLSTPGSATYTGTYSVNTNVVNQCLLGPVLNLSYPNATNPTSTLALTLDSPLCPGANVTFNITAGTGVFASASGGGAVTYTQPETFNFIDSTSGGGFLGVGGRSGGVSLSATPELGSFLLFGTGALGLAGYGLTRMRARRKQRSA